MSVVDDDESVRESLPDLLRTLGFTVGVFASAEDFLASGDVLITACLILDVDMPGMSGPALNRTLRGRGMTIPVIFITAHGDAMDRSDLHPMGAADLLLKPFSEAALITALAAALPGHERA